MIGLQLHVDAPTIAAFARDRGLLIVPAGHNTIRLLPALIATPENLAKSVCILDDIFTNV